MILVAKGDIFNVLSAITIDFWCIWIASGIGFLDRLSKTQSFLIEYRLHP